MISKRTIRVALAVAMIGLTACAGAERERAMKPTIITPPELRECGDCPIRYRAVCARCEADELSQAPSGVGSKSPRASMDRALKVGWGMAPGGGLNS